MIYHCDRCGRELPDRVQSGPGTFTHLRDDLGTFDALICVKCKPLLDLFVAGAPLVGEEHRATLT